MRKLITFLVALLLLVATMPSLAVFAAETGTSFGSFTVGGEAPQITDFQTYSNATCTTVATNFTPQVTYYAKVTVDDANNLSDILEVKVKIYYDADTSSPANEADISQGMTQTAAIMTWTRTTGTGLWTIDAGTPTTWAIIPTSCALPESMDATTGDWIFAFKVGKVATESLGTAGWELHARVTDGTFYTHGSYLRGKQVLWYGQMTVNTDNVDFGVVNLGTGFGADVNKVTGISVTMISNGDFAGNGAVSEMWNGSNPDNIAIYDETGVCANANEFSLMTWGVDDFSKAVLITLDGANVMNNDQTSEDGLERDTITAWLKLSNTFPNDTYTGTVFYKIVNR